MARPARGGPIPLHMAITTLGMVAYGDTRGLMSAINDGRIQSASSGSVSVAGSEGHFRVNISWARAFGGSKTTVARLTADLSRGCVVESGGGVG